MDEAKYKDLLRKLSKLTASNNHTEARIAIAKFFGFDKELSSLQGLQACQKRQNCMYPQQIEAHTEITKKMIRSITFSCGEAIGKEVYSKL